MGLELRDITVTYGENQVVRGVDLDVDRGKVLGVLGPNASGKSSTAKAVAGAVRHGGTVRLDGADLTRLKLSERVRSGVVLSPQGKRLFESMSVEENVRMGAYARRREPGLSDDIDRTLGYFPGLPDLRGRPARALSGGQQQMVTLARSLMAKPSVLILDEPSIGVSPVVATQLKRVIRQVVTELNVVVVLVEQNVELALDVADQVCVLVGGRIVHSGKPDIFRDQDLLRSLFFQTT